MFDYIAFAKVQYTFSLLPCEQRWHPPYEHIHDLGQDVIFVSADNMRGAKLLEGKDKIGMECPGGITCNIPVTIADTGKMFQFLSKVLNEEYL